MLLDPLFVQFALILGLSLFFGLAFEEFHMRTGLARPGGSRTFPLLAIAGALLYELDPERKRCVAGAVIPFLDPCGTRPGDGRRFDECGCGDVSCARSAAAASALMTSIVGRGVS